MEQNTLRKKQWEPPKTIWNTMFFSILFANSALNLGQQMSNSLLSLYAKSTGAPADQIGQLMSMFALTALIFRFVSGPAMNAFNRKKLVMIAMCCMGTAYLGFSAAPIIAASTGLETITILKCFRLVQGVGNAFGNSCFLTIVSDALPKDKFTTGMGYYACGQVVAQAIGPTVGIFLRDTFGYNTTYVIVAGVMGMALLAALRVQTAPQLQVPFKLDFDNMIAKEALIPAFVTFLVAMGFNSINSFLLVYAEERGIVGGSLFFTVYSLTLLVTRPAVAKMTEKHGFARVAIPSLGATALSLALIGFATNSWTLLLSAFVNAFGYGAVQPMLQSLCMKSVPPERRGSASSTNFIFLDASTLVGPTLCGYVANIFGYTPAMWIAMTVPVILGMVFVFAVRKPIQQIEIAFQEKAA